jgi:hypothetical protein
VDARLTTFSFVFLVVFVAVCRGHLGSYYCISPSTDTHKPQTHKVARRERLNTHAHTHTHTHTLQRERDAHAHTHSHTHNHTHKHTHKHTHTHTHTHTPAFKHCANAKSCMAIIVTYTISKHVSCYFVITDNKLHTIVG